MPLPLQGIRILDLSRGITGGFCSQQLADFGAEVIKVENTTGGDILRNQPPLLEGEGTQFYMVNRNKKSITLNLRPQEGKDIFMKLAKVSDVLIDQFRPGVMERLGLGYEVLKKINPAIIYCSLSAYGMTGPMRDLSGHDLNFRSMSGMLSLIRDKNNMPQHSPISVAALAGGGLYAALGIMLALYQREKTGKGQLCEIAMVDGALTFMVEALAQWVGTGQLKPKDKAMPGNYAYYNIYQTKDNKYLSLGAIEMKSWEEFCYMINRSEYISLQGDMERQEEIYQGIQEIFLTRTRDEWVEFFAGHNVQLTPILEVDEVANHRQMQERKMIHWMKDFKGSGVDFPLTGIPIKLSNGPEEISTSFSKLGENNNEILSLLGYTNKEIMAYQTSGII